jgi:hypothetical protein
VEVNASTGSNTPTGTVNITGADTNCDITLNNGAGDCDVRFFTIGNKTITATYSGYGAFTQSDETATIDVFLASTTTITADDPDPSKTSQKVTVTVTVSGEDTIPTGTVEITGASVNCVITLTDGEGSCDVNFYSSGTKTITAVYSGDEYYTDSEDTEEHKVSFSSSGSSSSSSGSSTSKPSPILGISEFLPRPGYDWNNDGIVNVFDEFIEIINAGSIDVNLGSYRVDDEEDLGSSPYSLPNLKLKPGERAVFYASETGILFSDGGDTVRLLKGSKVVDAYTYHVARYPDQSWCRVPDRLGYWNDPCFPTPNNPNALTGTLPLPPGPPADYHAPVCLMPDTTPDVFVYAECEATGGGIWNRQYWDWNRFFQWLIPYNDQKWVTYFE